MSISTFTAENMLNFLTAVTKLTIPQRQSLANRLKARADGLVLRLQLSNSMKLIMIATLASLGWLLLLASL